MQQARCYQKNASTPHPTPEEATRLKMMTCEFVDRGDMDFMGCPDHHLSRDLLVNRRRGLCVCVRARMCVCVCVCVCLFTTAR